ncbi:PIG-X [Nemania sp. NC0429]|nr:PIG-X [Nemania sp. NC0429]
MRHRITFFHRNEHGIEPSSLNIHDRSISGLDVVAVREHRVTLALEELPAELRQLLGDIQELYVRWSTPRAHDSLGPWTSRLPPGLHTFYTPRTASVAHSAQPCTQLRSVFGELDCTSPAESFTKLPTDRFSHSAAFQYFQPLDSLTSLSAYVAQHACVPDDPDCNRWADELENAVSLDFSYNAVSHAVTVAAVWPEGRQRLSVEAHPDHRTEVGILTPDTPPHLEPNELGVTGLLTVLGEDKKPAPVLFAFPSRHKDTGSTFSSTFLQPLGLHPTLQLKIDSGKPPLADSSCSLHAYLTLPRTIFADKYQLGDDLFLASKNLTALRYISQPVDLEAPEYAVRSWGSSVLLELQPPPDTQADSPWTAEIPLHLRYLSPAEGGYGSISVPSPALFWACNSEEGTKFPNSPFDRVNLGYDGLFGPRTLFWHVNPRSSEGNGGLNHQIRVPVLDTNKTEWVAAGTAAVVLAGFAYIVWKLASVYWRTGYGDQRRATGGEKKQQ